MNKIKKIFPAILILAIPLFTSAQNTGWNPSTLSSSGLPSGQIGDIIRAVLFWLLGSIGVLAVIGFVISGIMYIVSTGDDDTIKKAKSYMFNCIIGVVVALSGLVIVYAVDRALRGYAYF